ncbi:MAG: hypothetical protein LBU11_03540 [Zoogloeaceae bacterium]|nr:hypothetical protein [Zoogloeaceae bacterium]
MACSIVGQQISSKAQQTIWARIKTGLGKTTLRTICAVSEEKLQGYGISRKKAGYIRRAAEKIRDGHLDLDAPENPVRRRSLQEPPPA